jgi:hypothetical protein
VVAANGGNGSLDSMLKRVYRSRSWPNLRTATTAGSTPAAFRAGASAVANPSGGRESARLLAPALRVCECR